jgi:hypothetical protein
MECSGAQCILGCVQWQRGWNCETSLADGFNLIYSCNLGVHWYHWREEVNTTLAAVREAAKLTSRLSATCCSTPPSRWIRSTPT